MKKGLTRCNKWMFQEVKCRAYMRKVNDGRFINFPTGNPEDAIAAIKGYDPETDLTIVEDVTLEDGDYDLEKTYYERTEKEFVGVVVGIKDVVATGVINVGTEYDFTGREYTKLSKWARDTVKCALVYYGCNRSRYVPIEDMKIMKN